VDAASANISVPAAATTATSIATVAPAPVRPPPKPLRKAYAVGLRVVRLVDTSRQIQLPDGSSAPRVLITYVRYPAFGSPSGGERLGAPPAVRGAPFPLLIFGHGYNVTPAPYNALMRAWARAGYVVAAPVFPLENPGAPGGPNENDMVNQPGDMSFVISRLTAAAAGPGWLHGLIDRHAIAVSGQSDGGDTALAAAYQRSDRDHRIRAAVILSGAEIPGLSGFAFPPGSPPLLATQGTADDINPPGMTAQFYDAAARPKYLLQLLGAPHLPPYTTEQPQLGIVEQVTIAFLDRYLKHEATAIARMRHAGHAPGIATLYAHP
jgi:dienelactone hydrolase